MPGTLKMDADLLRAYRAWLAEDMERDPDRSASLVVHVEGNADGVEDAGLSVAAQMDDEVVGSIRYADLDRLSALPNVVRITAGRANRPLLNTAAPDIRARAKMPADIGGTGDDHGLWQVDPTTGVLDPGSLATGKGIVLAVIDTGIDVTHPMFNKSVSPQSYDTRIVRIWDQGATPRAGESPPDPDLLVSTASYGVELTKTDIDTELNDSLFPILPHRLNTRDCDGHGTSVTSIAAGGRTFSRGADAKRVGIAPEADIVVVKHIDIPVVQNTAGDVVTDDVRFRDAFMYCIRVARAAPPDGIGPKPVVINVSLGSLSESGDGLTAEDRWLDARLDPTVTSPDATQFPKGAIVVRAAGNSGDSADRQHAKITIPDSGEIDVPFQLFDDRGPNRTIFYSCTRFEYTPTLEVNFWLRGTNPPAESLRARVPGETAFSQPVFAGFREHTFDSGKTMQLSKDLLPIVQRPTPAGGTVGVRRSQGQLLIFPSTGASPQHTVGTYDVRIEGPPGTVIYAMCEQAIRDIGFRIAPTYRDGTALPAAQTIAGAGPIEPIEVTGAYTVMNAGGRNFLTVSSYDDESSDRLHHPATGYTSRGPLRDFSNPPLGPLADKPDIAGPGGEISAARSKDTENGFALWGFPEALGGNRFEDMSGTSAAAPFVSGVVALMLQKNPNLSITKVRAALNAAATARGGPIAAAGIPAGAYGAGMVDALDSYAGTTP